MPEYNGPQTRSRTKSLSGRLRPDRNPLPEEEDHVSSQEESKSLEAAVGNLALVTFGAVYFAQGFRSLVSMAMKM